MFVLDREEKTAINVDEIEVMKVSGGKKKGYVYTAYLRSGKEFKLTQETYNKLLDYSSRSWSYEQPMPYIAALGVANGSVK